MRSSIGAYSRRSLIVHSASPLTRGKLAVLRLIDPSCSRFSSCKTLQPFRRSDGIPNYRSAQFHALSGTENQRQSAGQQDHLGVPQDPHSGGYIEALFFRSQQHIFANAGQIIDASFVEVPRQRNTRHENELIKQGETPEAWKAKPNKLRQKDRDARWAKKNQMNFYGYKNHIKAGRKTKLMSDYMVTDYSKTKSRISKSISLCSLS